MALLAGKPVLQHVIERCKQIKVADNCDKKIIVAVPDTPESEPMLQLVDQLDVHNFCGSENNVLERYYQAAQFFKLNVIMRITADCPLINPLVCEEVLNIFATDRVDYASNVYPKRTFPKGLDCEVFSFECLEATYTIVTEASNLDRIHEINIMSISRAKQNQEHVTSFMQDTSGITKACLRQKKDKSHQNLCVDEPQDIEVLEKYLQRNPQELKIVK